jgi:hypothetical protein
MAARASMTELITRIRGLIHDPAGTSTTFTDQEIQDALDTWRDETRYLELMPLETLAPTGIIYRDYVAERGAWEADEILVDAAYEPLTPATADRLTGRWTFDDDTPPPVYLTGKPTICMVRRQTSWNSGQPRKSSLSTLARTAPVSAVSEGRDAATAGGPVSPASAPAAGAPGTGRRGGAGSNMTQLSWKAIGGVIVGICCQIWGRGIS